MGFTPAHRKQLRQDFIISMAYFNLPKDVQRIAWEAAQRSEIRAAKCYRAIVLSLPK